MKKQTYQNSIAVLFALTWGLVLLDRNAIAFLFPVLMKEFNLNNAQTGQIVMWYRIWLRHLFPLSDFPGRQIRLEKTVAGSGHHPFGNIFRKHRLCKHP